MSEPTPTLYGIKNCDTVRKARQWLDEHGIDYRFHDFRADGLEPALLMRFEEALGWEALLNRRGTTWRTLDESERANIGRESAIALMLAKPALIKRPVLESDGGIVVVGFSPDDYSRELQTPCAIP